MERDVREVLEAAFLTLFGPEPPSEYDGRAWTRNGPDFSPAWTAYISRRNRFRRFLDAEAWTSAAEMLIPTDGSMALLDVEYSYDPTDPGVWSACTIRWYPKHKSGNDWHARIESGSIPALAIAQAALKTKDAEHAPE